MVQHEEQIKRLLILMSLIRDGDRSLDSLLNSMSHCVVSFDYCIKNSCWHFQTLWDEFWDLDTSGLDILGTIHRT